MQVIKKPDLVLDVKIAQEKAIDVLVEEKQSNISLREKLTYFYIGKDVFFCVFLLVMLVLVFSGAVSIPAFFFSQIINAVIRGRGKGLNTVTESLFPKKE